VKVGIIGAGYWGRNLIRVAHELGILESVCDANQAALAPIAERYPRIAVERDLVSFLNRNIDAVLIAAPAPLHAELALEAIAAEKHIFVEKPLAMSPDEAATVVRAARAGGRTLFVGHVLLYHPAVQRMLGLIREGAIGQVRHVRSRRLSWGKLRAAENVWWSFAPHDVALVLEIFEEEPQSVRGSTSAFVRSRVADFAYADLVFSRARSAHIEVSWIDPDKSSRLDVFGSEGVLRLCDSRDGASLTLTPCGQTEDEFAIPSLWRREEQEISFSPAEPLMVELRAFVDAIRTGSRPLTDGEEGWRVVSALSMLSNESRRQRDSVEVPA
jgi:UDP-2-acetamido-3-amino-2,3-dideoxy-glucuronate N-acetyltransferase